MVLLALTLTLCLGAAAFAENAAEEPAAAEKSETVETAKNAETADKALEDAMNAYKAAKRSAQNQKKMDALKSELDSYVQAGNLTQEQADLILSYTADQQSQKDAARAERQKLKEEKKNIQDQRKSQKDNGGRHQKGSGNSGNNGRNSRNNNSNGWKGRGNRMNNSFPMGSGAPVMQQGTSL